ncbi:MAG: hypothetical protein BMS9Abin03_401 [Thermodesulfobacteriota bacterium]|nr:MAG: hypothetical protein BMS9Abin03_401 [Thermodesulfobacteriota bacterium]
MHSKTVYYTVLIFPVLFIICMADAVFAFDSSTNYSILIDLIKLEDKQDPFFALNDFEKSFDQDLHNASIEFFNQHPDVIKKIQEDLDDQPIRWRLKNISHRFMYIPETREEYAKIFERYCNDVIGDILKLTEFKNPYITIHTLGASKPENLATKGINAFIVHNLGKEYVATYVFSNKDQKEIAIELTGKIFLAEVGAYSSYIYLNENGSFEFTRDHCTIWQNSAKNQYTVLITPVEETLHIVLRQYTERSIQDRIENRAVKTLKEVEAIVEDWICVEEAIVGGLVYALLPSIVEKYIPDLPDSLVESDIKTKIEFKKYRHLKKGIKIVEQLGYKKSIKMYRDDPMAFRSLLM